jgi:hypothetical protein
VSVEGDVIKSITTAMAAGAAILALIGTPVAHADPDPADYFDELRKDGILVDGNENYLLGLAMIVCNMRNAGYDDDGPIGDYIARRENIPNIKGYDIALDADIWYCSRLHPRLVP